MKLFFSLKWATYQKNMLFCCFEAFLGKFTENISFLFKKRQSQKADQKYIKSLFYSTSLERGKSRGKFGFVVNINGTNINKNCFSPQNELHITKLCFSVVLKHFLADSLKLLFLVKIVTISERITEILRKFDFLNKFEKGQILRKIWICLNNYF